MTLPTLADWKVFLVFNDMPLMNPPEISKPCCDVWENIAPHLRWHSFEQWSDILTMPTIMSTDWRVNFCPSCGQEVRSVVWHRDLLRDAR